MFMTNPENGFMERRVQDMPDDFLGELFKRWMLGDTRITKQNRDLVVNQIDLRSGSLGLYEPDAEDLAELHK